MKSASQPLSPSKRVTLSKGTRSNSTVRERVGIGTEAMRSRFKTSPIFSMFKIEIRRIEEVNGSSNGAPLAPRCSILWPDFRRHRCNLTFQVLATQRNCSFLTITIPPSFQIGNTDSPFLLKKEKA